MTTEQQKAVLQAEVIKYVRQGFIVVSQTDTTAQLVKHKKFSLFWAVIWFLLAIVPLILYILYYMAKKDEQVFLVVDENGKVKVSR